MKRFFYFLAFSNVFCLSAPNAQAQYQSTGPFGGQAYSIYRENGGRIVVAGDNGLFSSNDEGKSWQEISPTPADLGCATLYSVALTGADIYAGGDAAGIYISHDGGAHWTTSRSGLKIAVGRPFYDIEVAGPNVLAIRPDSGYLFLSQNQGISWSQINASISSSFAQYLSTYNGAVYVSAPQGLFQSMDNGMSYTNINSLPVNYGKLVWVSDTAYVATASGIRVSYDQGITFSAFALTGRSVRDVAVSGQHVYAIVRGIAPIQDSVLYSSDGGQSFSTAAFNPATFRFTRVNDILATSGGLLVASDYSIYGTMDSGAHWSLADSGFLAASGGGLAASGAYIVAGTASMGLYRAIPDSGSLQWQHTGDVSQQVGTNILSVAAHGAYVHAGGAGGYYRSTDSGATWTAGTAGVSGGLVKSVCASPNSSDAWLIRNGDLYYSSDDGASFGTVVTSNLPAGQCERVMQADTALFVCSFSTLYKAGSTLAFSPVSGISGFVTAVIRIGSTYYAATKGNGLFNSADGAAWVSINTGVLPVKINALIADSAGTGLLAGTDDGIFSNSNGGIWQQVALAGHAVQVLALRHGKVFAGTCSGVYSIPYKLLPVDNGVGNKGQGKLVMQVVPNPNKGNFSIRLQCSVAAPAVLSLR
ncbi:MAG: hypothetical protein JST27_01525, partial [Bacteroidetes bacterium]|nr:hypothetical protein [Bacteroidota bacterium]